MSRTKRDPRSEIRSSRDLDTLIQKHWEDEGSLDGDLWVVHKRNPYFPIGTYVYSFMQGFQRVILEPIPAPEGQPSNGPLWRLNTTDSLMIPHSQLRPYVKKMPRRQF